MQSYVSRSICFKNVYLLILRNIYKPSKYAFFENICCFMNTNEIIKMRL